MAVSDEEKAELKGIFRETFSEIEAERESARAEKEAKEKAGGKKDDGDGGEQQPPKRTLAQRLLG